MERRTAARGVAACALAAALAPAVSSRAQDASPRQAAAGALFRDARRLMGAGKLDEACPKFVAAQKLDPTVGTALNIGECFERAGKTASAWAGFDEARMMARREGDEPRAAEAERRAKRIEPTLSKLLLTAPPGGLSAGSELRLDAVVIDAAAIGTAIPVDPGVHALELAGPGPRWSTTVTVPSQPVTVTVALPGPAALTVLPVAPPPPAASFWGAQRIAGVSVGAVGLAGVVVGAVFGAQAIARKNESNDGHCDALDRCDPRGKSLRLDGVHAGNVSTATFIVGGAALAAAVVLFATAPRRVQPGAGGPRLGLAVGPGDLRLTGRW